MARTHVQPGNVIDVPLTASYAAGELILVGTIVGVCLASGGNGDTISVAIDEVFNVAKLSTDNMTIGAQVYLDADDKRVTLAAASGANLPAGRVTKAAGASTTTVNVKLNF